jgi:hypothetical protein
MTDETVSRFAPSAWFVFLLAISLLSAVGLGASVAGAGSPAAPAVSLRVVVTSTAMAGQPLSVVVTARDATGKIVTGYTGTVTLTSGDSQAVLPAAYAYTKKSAGTHTFSVKLMSAGSQTIGAADAGQLSGSGSVTVSLGSVAGFGFTGLSPARSGAGQFFNVSAVNSYGVLVPGYVGTVHFTSSDPAAILPADLTFSSDDGSTVQQYLTMKAAGTKTVTARDTVNAKITGTAKVTVTSGTPAKLVVSAPKTLVNGQTLAYKVTALDLAGNVATEYSGTVKFKSDDDFDDLPADYTFVAATDKGVHTFSPSLDHFSDHTITVSDVSWPPAGVQSASATITFLEGSTSGFLLSLQGSGYGTAVAGGNVCAGYAPRNAYGGKVNRYPGTMHFSSTDKAATGLPDDQAWNPNRDYFYMSFKTAGKQTVTIADTKNSKLKTTVSINVLPGPLSQITMTAPSSVRFGKAFNVTVTARDVYGNILPGYTGTVKITDSDSSAVLPAAFTFNAKAKGSHSFPLTLKSYSGQTITATDSGNHLSASFDIWPG